MSLRKIGQFLNERPILVVGTGIIISIHWGWYKLQQVPSLVPESERKGFPLFRAVGVIGNKLVNSLSAAPDSKIEKTVAKTK